MNDTPTPRTDAFAKSIDQSNFEDSWKDDFEEFAWVPADFARTLERELTAAREELDEMTLRWELTNDSLFDKRALADRLAEALKRIANNNVQDEPHTCYAYEFGRMEGIAKIALAAVKGGSDES